MELPPGTLFCRVQGGLGNQLFQVATTIALSTENGRIYRFYRNTESKSVFEPRPVYWNTLLKLMQPYLINDDAVTECFPLHEQSFAYRAIRLPPPFFNLELMGYFQSYKYFHMHRPHLIDLFLPADLCDVTQQKFQLFCQACAVPSARTISLHIRRGDYLRLSDKHPVLSFS